MVLHDIHQIGSKMSSNERLFAILKGIKIIPILEKGLEVNIGAIILDDDIDKKLFDIFCGMYTTWKYIPPVNQVNRLIDYFSKYYGTKYLNFFKFVLDRNIKINNDIKLMF